jgi:SAM-dependent methyltransferase
VRTLHTYGFLIAVSSIFLRVSTMAGMSSEAPSPPTASDPIGEPPRYRTWIRMSRVCTFAAVTLICVAGAALAPVSAWFLLSLVPAGIFGYITLILTLTVYRFGPHGGDFQRRIHQLIADHAGARPGQVLDVGCGSGSLAIAVAMTASECTVEGIDSWSSNWEYSQQQCERNAHAVGVGERVTFRQQSAAALSYPDASFDTVVSCLTFHEVRDSPNRTDAMVEALRILRPGGRFVFLDLFADSGHFTSIQHVRDAVARAGASITSENSLHELLPLPYPLRDSKVLGHAVLLTGARSAA